MPVTPSRSKVLFLPVVRGIYDRSRTHQVKAALQAACKRVGIDGIFPADDACSAGLIVKQDDVRAYWETWRAELADIKALVAVSSDFMWERSVMDTARLLPEDVPVLLIVNNDNPAEQVKGGFVGDTLCGSLSVHHNLRMLGRPLLRAARIDMHDAVALDSVLLAYRRLSDGAEALRHMNIALLGVNPTPFATTFTNQLELFRLGFSLHTYELLDMWGEVVLGSQLEGDATSYSAPFGDISLERPIRRADERVQEVRVQLNRLELCLPADEQKVERLCRCLVWIGDTFERDAIDSGAIHCWPEFARYFGMAPCAVAMFANALLGTPVVCEVDVCHAIMARLANVLSDEPSVILDINNNGWDDRVFNVFHCSQTPPNWLNEGAEVTPGGQVTGVIRPVPFTAISAATSADSFDATVFTGRFLKQDPGQRGSSGWAFVPNLPHVLEAVEQSGIHHFVAMKGHLGADVADVLRFKGIDVSDLSTTVPTLDEIEADLPPIAGA